MPATVPKWTNKYQRPGKLAQSSEEAILSSQRGSIGTYILVISLYSTRTSEQGNLAQWSRPIVFETFEHMSSGQHTRAHKVDITPECQSSAANAWSVALHGHVNQEPDRATQHLPTTSVDRDIKEKRQGLQRLVRRRLAIGLEPASYRSTVTQPPLVMSPPRCCRLDRLIITGS